MFGCDYQPEKWHLTDVLSEDGVYLIFLSMWSVSLRRWCLSQHSISFHVKKESNQGEILSHRRSPTHNCDVILLNYSFIQGRTKSLCQVHACNSFNLLKGEFCLLIWQPWKLCWQKRSFQITAHVLVSQQSLLWSTFLRNISLCTMDQDPIIKASQHICVKLEKYILFSEISSSYKPYTPPLPFPIKYPGMGICIISQVPYISFLWNLHFMGMWGYL